MEIERVFDLLPYSVKNNFRGDALAAKESGSWIKYSTRDFVDSVNDLAYGMLLLNVKEGDKIAIMSNNRPEWNFADYAIQITGAVSVPVYPTVSVQDLSFILNDAMVSMMFVSSKEMYDKVQSILTECPHLRYVFTFDFLDEPSHYKTYAVRGFQCPNPDEIKRRCDKIKGSDLLTILYTSGTTGTPKGVMLSHQNMLSNSFASQDLAPFEKTWKALSFLPLNHVYERMLNTLYIYMGVGIYYAESLETIAQNLNEVRPHIFATVPRLLEKVYDKIVAKGNDLTGIKKWLFFWALKLGLRYETDGANGWWYEFQLKIANKLIFTKWRDALGGRVAAVVSGGAALQPRLARVFNAARITVLEGYGLTETSPVIAVNNFKPGCIRFGTVGPVLNGVTVKFAVDGEILVKGPNIMLGYYNRPDATAEAIDKDGWFHTGDIGEMVDGKFLKITDRKKEIFKTSGGKYIAPIKIENKLKESPFIEQVMVIGEGQKFPSALVVPCFPYVTDYFLRKDIVFSSNREMIHHPEVLALLNEEKDKMNEDLAQYEKIKKIILLEREWSIDRGELTPKLSLKRKVIYENNKLAIEQLYSQE